MKVRIICWRDIETDKWEPLEDDDLAELIEYGIEVGEVHFRVEEGEFK